MSLLKYVMFLLLVEFSKGAIGYISSKEKEGYIEGYLPDCPGSTKPAFVKKKSLKDIGIVVVGGDGSTKAYRRTYNYYQAKEIAKDPNLDLKKKTVFFFGGFLDSPKIIVSTFMAKTYRKLGYNVLLISINKFLTIHYPVAARFIPPVCQHLAEMLTNVTEAGLELKNLEFAGVSLGAQIMSFVAKSYQRLTGRNIPLLTGLDPAGPCFRNRRPEDRLDKADGDYVQVIATNIDGLGSATPVGHANFYVNGGEYQPADFYWMPCNAFCSHIRSYMIWASALRNPSSFIGLKCDTIQQARRHECYDRVPRETNVISNTKFNRSSTGIFYVATDNNQPYFLGSSGLRKENEFWTKHMSEWNKDEVVRI